MKVKLRRKGNMIKRGFCCCF